MSEDPDRAEGHQTSTGERMQRVRIGLTGLAVVLLIVALSTAVFRHVGKQVADGGTVNSVVPPPVSSDEPLAKLGVAPGAADDTGNNATKQP